MVEIRPVASGRERDLFIRLPWRIYRDDQRWAAPLLQERKRFLDPNKNPFFDFSDVALFLAWRDGEVVGRIAAIEDRNYNAYHGAKAGGFGMFEATNDRAVAQILFATVREWCRDRGLATLWGPVNLSTNYDCGLLVEGFEDPPAIGMPYNPPYYQQLFVDAGLQKVKDLWAWTLAPDTSPPPKVVHVAERLRKRGNVNVRPLRVEELGREIAYLEVIYNDAWQKNWGFVPITKAELNEMANNLKRILAPELALVVEVNGEPAGFSLTIPDLNEALVRARSQWLPIALMQLSWHARRIRRARLMALGVRAAYRRRGIEALLYLDTLQKLRELGYTRGEVSWTLEDNELVNRAIESMGGRQYKTYRLYQVEIT